MDVRIFDFFTDIFVFLVMTVPLKYFIFTLPGKDMLNEVRRNMILRQDIDFSQEIIIQVLKNMLSGVIII